jgi:hypothetical protein
MIKIFEKVFWPVMITLVVILFSILIYQNIQIEKKQAGMYCIQIGKEDYWTKEIRFDSDGSLNFVNYENNRPYKIYGGNYIIAQPKIK